VVWFYPSTSDPLFRAGYTDPMAAVVARVWSDRMVNLTVFDPDGNPHAKTSVHLIQPGDPSTSSTHCTWMPYQIGQAAKHTA
jgi:hypothetical protein